MVHPIPSHCLVGKGGLNKCHSQRTQWEVAEDFSYWLLHLKMIWHHLNIILTPCFFLVVQYFHSPCRRQNVFAFSCRYLRPGIMTYLQPKRPREFQGKSRSVPKGSGSWMGDGILGCDLSRSIWCLENDENEDPSQIDTGWKKRFPDSTGNRWMRISSIPLVVLKNYQPFCYSTSIDISCRSLGKHMQIHRNPKHRCPGS